MFSCFKAQLVAGIVGFAFAIMGCRSEEPEPPPQANPSAEDKKTSAPETAIRFTEKTATSGVDFQYQNGEQADHFTILESLGGGVGMCDYDCDGQLDLIFAGGGAFTEDQKILGRSVALFRQFEPWRFQQVTDSADVMDSSQYNHGIAAADFDNDGFPDFLVTGYGELRFYHNLGDGTFEEISQSVGLTDTLWSSSAAWGDLNGDGALDLYVAHYVDWSWENHPVCRGYRTPRDVCSPQQFAPLPDTVYLNQGDGTFREASKEVGLRSDGKGLGVLMADLDLDGKIDVYVGNDTVPNFFYQNTKNGHLKDESLTSGASRNSRGLPDGSMGVDVGDYNRDGRPDLWVANYENETFALYRNEGDGFFQHVSQAMGVTAVGQLAVGWGTVFADFDLDGDEDLFTSNGHVVRYPHNVPVNQPPFLFENIAGEQFVNVAPSAGNYLNTPHRGRGLAAGDLDRDGDWDLVISHQNEPVSLLSNESPRTKNHWLTIHLRGVVSNRDAIGARVTLHTANGEFSRQRKGGGSYASTHTPDLHFGLGTSDHIDRLVVHWPSGQLTELENLSTDQHLDLVEPAKP